MISMSGEQRIAVSRQLVWEALNDPQVLKQCIPGCQSLERESDERLKATVAIKVGPIGARFAGAVTLSDVDPANAYTIMLEGHGGTAGFAKGSARVRLADEGSGTLLTYEAGVQVGGRLAQLGGAIIDSTAKQLAGSFFERFGKIAAGPAAPSPAEAVPSPAEPSPQPAAPAATAPHIRKPAITTPAVPRSEGPPMAWILAVVVGALVGFLVGRAQGGDAVPIWAGLSMGLLIVIVAAAGFEFGRRAAAPIVMLDSALLARLTARSAQTGQ